METKVQTGGAGIQTGAEPTPEERKHLEECRREEMKLLENKGDAPDPATEKEDITYATVKVAIPHVMRPVYKKFMETVIPSIIETVSNELSNVLSAFYEGLTEYQEGGTR